MTTASLAPRTALFLPASNPRAIAKARELAADMVILDLEDAVRDERRRPRVRRPSKRWPKGSETVCARSA